MSEQTVCLWPCETHRDRSMSLSITATTVQPKMVCPHCEPDWQERYIASRSSQGAKQRYDEPLEWSGAVPFLTMAQNCADPNGPPWGDEFMAWYEPERWFGEHRACAIWLGMKFAGLAPAMCRIDGGKCGEGGYCANCPLPQADARKLLAASPLPAPQEPVWIQPDHLAKARLAPFLCRVEPKQRDDFVPLYAAPAPDSTRGTP